MRAWFLVCCVGLALLSDSSRAQVLEDSSLAVTPYRSGFSSPTGFSFLPDGSLFVIEKGTGQVRHVNSAGSTTTTALDLVVNSDSERGLLGIALDPDFSTNGFTYLYYSVDTGAADSDVQSAWAENWLSRFTWNGTSLASESVLLSFARDPVQANGPNHNGGPLFFGPDRKLYGITGDLGRSGIEQNQGSGTASSGVGGLFRINSDGSLPSESGRDANPFITHPNQALRKLYAYGIRNSFGLAVDPISGAIWDTENGPEVYDEINLVSRGFNSGWTKIMGPDSRDPQNVSDLVVLPGAAYSDPKFSFLNPIGITDIEFLTHFNSDARYENAVVFGDVNLGQLHILRLNSTRDGFDVSGDLTDLVVDNATERNSILFGSSFGVTTDIQVGPDNALYVLSLSDGVLYRIASTATDFVLGDMDGDGSVDGSDLQAFALGLASTSEYLTAFPALGNFKMRGDVNSDLRLNNLDILPFELLASPNPLFVPEPSAGLLAACGFACLFLLRFGAKRRRP